MNAVAVHNHPSSDDLRRFASGLATVAEIASIESHLGVCPECCEKLKAVGNDTLVDLLRRPTESIVAPAADSALTIPPQGGSVHPDMADRMAPTSSAAADAEPEIPPELRDHPRYRVLSAIGHGGMGSVFRAEHQLMERAVALKVIGRSLTAKPEMVERFRREVKAAARLSHPNIVQAFDAEQAGEAHFLVMEFVKGTDLARLVAERGPLPVALACAYVRQAALGLQHAFERGMTHRDVKPHNLMLTEDGTIKILDFGLARFASEAGGTPAAGTSPGMILGTVDYMAPEQADNSHAADIRSDIYALGCTLYHLLTGQTPFPSGTVLQKIRAHAETEPTPVRQFRPEVSEALAAVLARMMAKDPARRWQTPAEVAVALASFVETTGTPAPAVQPVLRSPRRRWLVAAGMLGVLTLVAAAIIITVETDRGGITIRTEGADIEVVVRKNGDLVSIRDTKADKSWDLDTKKLNLARADDPDGLRIDLDANKPLILRRRDGRLVVTITGPTEKAKTEVTRRNPFGVPDVDDPDGAEVEAFAAKTKLAGAADDPNAEQWVTRATKGDKGALDGEWFGRWRRPYIGEDWIYCKGTAQIKTVGERVYILYTDHQDTFLIDTRRENGRLVGRVQGTKVRTDSCPCVFVIVGPDRLDGEFTDEDAGRRGRQDFRRKLAREPPAMVRRISVVADSGDMAHLFATAFSADGRYYMATGDPGARGGIRVWDVESGQRISEFFPGGDVWFTSAVFLSDSRHVLAAYRNDKRLRPWDGATGKLVRTFDALDVANVHKLLPGVTADGRRALSFEESGRTIRVWDVPTGKQVQKLDAPGEIRSVSFSPDRTRVLSSDAGNMLRVWNVETGKEEVQLKGHAGPCNGRFAPDGRRVLSWSHDGSLRLWDAATGKQQWSTADVGRPVLSAHFTPDGLQAVSAAADGSVVFWNLETGKYVRDFQVAGEVPVFHPNGRLLLTTPPPGDGFIPRQRSPVRVYDLVTGKELHCYYENLTARGLSFSPDGRYAASGSFREGVFLYRLPEAPSTPRLTIRPAKLTADEVKHVLAELPAVFRAGLTGSPEEQMRALGLRTWAFSYEGGPITGWFEVQETGQATLPPRIPHIPGANYRAKWESGRIVIWLQPRSAKEMRPDVRNRLAKAPRQVPDYFLGLDMGPGQGFNRQSNWPGFREPQAPLWFGWAKADVKEASDPVVLQTGETGTLLLAEATEKDAAKPRAARLALKIRKE